MANPARRENARGIFLAVFRPPGEGGAEAISRESEYLLPLLLNQPSGRDFHPESHAKAAHPSAHRTEIETQMTPPTSTTAVGAAALWASVLLFTAPADGAFTLADIQNWTGVPAGPEVYEAVLVIDWSDGSVPLAWGYRWYASEPKRGSDMLNAIVGADPVLIVTGVEGGFVDSITYGERTQTGLPVQPFTYWQYWVNNEVIEGTPANNYDDAAHVLPPNGNPYEGEGSGRWVTSSTGLHERPLANGSWDGYVYGNFGETDGPLEPMAAPMVPEPGTLVLAAGALGWLFRRRVGA